ncbi:MAG: carbohydrate ABC transporter permease [Spirochaetaceae bacterium]|nr:carbohydrate ABC transporter permease [Spirochaetaceae bacterium]
MASVIRLTKSDRMFNAFVVISLLIIFIILFVPIWSTITLSFRPNDFIGTALDGMVLPPWKWSLAAYKSLLGNNSFVKATANSFRIFFEGIATALILTTPLAYALSIKTLPGRKLLYVFIIIPYLFDVGLVPNYLLVTRLGLTNKLAAVYLPGAISVYNTLIMKSFFEGIPEELKESARIDGASEFKVLMRIILPLSKPIMLTIGLYYGVRFWNDFFNAMLYLNDSNLQPLPILLRNILLSSGMNEYVEASAFGEAPIEAIKAASVLLAAIPMLVAYPFIQKYFVKGTMLGSIKG